MTIDKTFVTYEKNPLHTHANTNKINICPSIMTRHKCIQLLTNKVFFFLHPNQFCDFTPQNKWKAKNFFHIKLSQTHKEKEKKCNHAVRLSHFCSLLFFLLFVKMMQSSGGRLSWMRFFNGFGMF